MAVEIQLNYLQSYYNLMRCLFLFIKKKIYKKQFSRVPFFDSFSLLTLCIIPKT